MRRFSALICVAILSSQLVNAQSGEHRRPRGGSENSLLGRAMKMQPNLRYTGVRKLVLRNGVEEKTSTESVWFDRGRLRIEYGGTSPNAGQVVVVNGGKRFHFFPDVNEIQVSRARKDEFSRLGEILRGGPNVRTSETAGGSIAGQQTKLLSIQDGAGNVFARLWIEPETGMVLKREMFDQSGRKVGSMEFTVINFKPTFSETDFQISRKGARLVTMAQSMEKMAKKLGLPNYQLRESSGFTLDMVRPMKLPGGEMALSAAYSRERMGRVTLFILPAAVDESKLLKAQGNRLSSAVRTIGSTRLVLVGGLPKSELEKLLAEVS